MNPEEIKSLEALLKASERGKSRQMQEYAKAKYRNHIIEECARTIDAFAELHSEVPAFRYAAAAIRALKGGA